MPDAIKRKAFLEALDGFGDIEKLTTFVDDLANAPELVVALKVRWELVRAWEQLWNRPTRTNIKYLNLFSDGRTITARTNLLEHLSIEFEAQFPYLLQEELTAVHLYTTRAYQYLNSALRDGGTLSPYHQAFKDVLEEALDKMPKHTDTYYRGTSVPQSVLDEYIAALPPGSGKTYSDNAFSSTSSVDTWIELFQRLTRRPGEVKVIITGSSQTGVYIDDISFYGKNFKTDPAYIQHEVLFKPGTRFEHFAEPDIFQNEAGEMIYHFFMNEVN